MSVAEVAAFAPAAAFAVATEEAVLAPLVEPPELFCLRVAVRRVFSSLAHGLAEPGILPLEDHPCKRRTRNTFTYCIWIYEKQIMNYKYITVLSNSGKRRRCSSAS